MSRCSISVRLAVCLSLFLLLRSSFAALARGYLGTASSLSLSRTRERHCRLTSLRTACDCLSRSLACLSSSRALSFFPWLSLSLSVTLRYEESRRGLLVADTWQTSTLHFVALLSRATPQLRSERMIARRFSVLFLPVSISLTSSFSAALLLDRRSSSSC